MADEYGYIETHTSVEQESGTFFPQWIAWTEQQDEDSVRVMSKAAHDIQKFLTLEAVRQLVTVISGVDPAPKLDTSDLPLGKATELARVAAKFREASVRYLQAEREAILSRVAHIDRTLHFGRSFARYQEALKQRGIEVLRADCLEAGIDLTGTDEHDKPFLIECLLAVNHVPEDLRRFPSSIAFRDARETVTRRFEEAQLLEALEQAFGRIIFIMMPEDLSETYIDDLFPEQLTAMLRYMTTHLPNLRPALDRLSAQIIGAAHEARPFKELGFVKHLDEFDKVEDTDDAEDTDEVEDTTPLWTWNTLMDAKDDRALPSEARIEELIRTGRIPNIWATGTPTPIMPQPQGSNNDGSPVSGGQ